jgi:hypothetical protein
VPHLLALLFVFLAAGLLNGALAVEGFLAAALVAGRFFFAGRLAVKSSAF